MYEALIISDLHLNSPMCVEGHLYHFLDDLYKGRIQTERLVLNGDVFDSMNFDFLTPKQNKILTLLHDLFYEDKIQFHWIIGNHDKPIGILEWLFNTNVWVETARIDSGGKSILFTHGHQSDNYVKKHSNIKGIGVGTQQLLRRDEDGYVMVKTSKKYNKVADYALAYAGSHAFQIVCCGHTHRVAYAKWQNIEYFNSGGWISKPCTLLSLQNGVINIHTYRPSKGGLSSPIPLRA